MPLVYTLLKNEDTGAVTIHYSEPEGFSVTGYEIFSDNGQQGVKDADGNVLDYLNSFFSVDYSDEYDSFSSDGRNLMDQLAAGTGGVVTDDIDVLASATASDTVVYRDPVMIIAAACCALTLLDIAIRKLRWADLRGLFSRKT
jgi:hypothetical protein